MIETLKLIKEYGSDKNTEIEIGEIIDNFPNEKLSSWIYKISISTSEINKILGTDLKENNIKIFLRDLILNINIFLQKKILKRK